MPKELSACPLCGRILCEVREVEARIETMLDAAEAAGVDLWALEVRRRRLERDVVEYTDVRRGGRPNVRGEDELRRSIEMGVEVLATACKEMALRVRVEAPSR